VVSTAYDGRGNAFLDLLGRFLEVSAFQANPPITKWLPGNRDRWPRRGCHQPSRSASPRFHHRRFSAAKPIAGEDAGSSPLGARTWSYCEWLRPLWIICTDEDGKTRRLWPGCFRTHQSDFRKWTAKHLYHDAEIFDLANNLTNIVNANTQSIYYAYNDAGGLWRWPIHIWASGPTCATG